MSAAARKLGATQPTIGRQIRELEEICGELLFRRRGKSLEATPAALALRARAEDVEASVASLNQAFVRLGDSASVRVVRVTAPTLITEHLLPRILPEISAELPRAEFHILPSDAVLDLQRRHADIALRLTEPMQPDLVRQKIGRIDVGLIAARRYIQRRGTPNSVADFAQHEFILPTDDTMVKAAAAKAGLDNLSLPAVFRSDDLRCRHAMVKEGLGIGAGHDWMPHQDPDLIRVAPGLVINTLPVWLVATEDIKTSQTLRSSYDLLRETGRGVFKQ